MSENNQAEQEFRLSLLKALAARLRGGVVPLALPEATPEALDELLRGCGATGIPVPLEGGLRLPLKRFLTRFDAQPGEYAICLDKDTLQALSLTQTCYGQYIDTRIVDEIFSTANLATYALTCSVTTIACEAIRGGLVSIPLGLVEAGLACGTPALVAGTVKGSIAEEFRQNESLLQTPEFGLAVVSWPVAGGAGAALAARSLVSEAASLDAAKRAAELLTKPTKVKGVRRRISLFYHRRLSTTLVNRYFDAFFQGTKLPKILSASEKAVVISRATSTFDLQLLGYMLKDADEPTIRAVIKELEDTKSILKGIKREEGILRGLFRKTFGVDPDRVLVEGVTSMDRFAEKLGAELLENIRRAENLEKALQSIEKLPEPVRERLNKLAKAAKSLAEAEKVVELAQKLVELDDATLSHLLKEGKTAEEFRGALRDIIEHRRNIAALQTRIHEYLDVTVSGSVKDIADQLGLKLVKKGAERATATGMLADLTRWASRRTGRIGMARDIVESMLCQAAGAAAGTLAAARNIPPLPSVETLHLSLADGILKVGNVTVGVK